MKILLLPLVMVATSMLSNMCIACDAGASLSEELSDSKERAYMSAAGYYIKMVTGDYSSEPRLITIDREISNFSEPNDELWEIKFVNEKTGLQGLFFINPKTGNVFIACRPGEWKENECAYIKNGERDESRINYENRLITPE